MMFRRKLFWVLYALGLMFFLLFFFGQYLLVLARNASRRYARAVRTTCRSGCRHRAQTA